MNHFSKHILSCALAFGFAFSLTTGIADAHPTERPHQHGHQSWYRQNDGRVYYQRSDPYHERSQRNNYYYRDRRNDYYRDRRYRYNNNNSRVRVDLDDDPYYRNDRDVDLRVGPLDIDL